MMEMMKMMEMTEIMESIDLNMWVLGVSKCRNLRGKKIKPSLLHWISSYNKPGSIRYLSWVKCKL